MTPEKKVEQFMDAMGQPVRYQPVDLINTSEVLGRIDLMMNKLYELGHRHSVEPIVHAAWKFHAGTSSVDPATVLRILAELDYLITGTYHTFGVTHYRERAFEEIHESNMSRRWPDGKIHRDARGQFLKPETYHGPVMKDVIKSFEPELNLFEGHQPPVVQHDEDSGPVTLD